MSKVLINVSSKEDYNFIKKLYGYFSYIGLSPVYICTNSIVYFYLKFKENDVHLVPSLVSDRVDSTGFENYISFNVNSGAISTSQAIVSAVSFYHYIGDYIEKHSVRMMIIPSGRMLSQKVMKSLSLDLGIPAIYIGYGNLPGKTFLDPLGTDRDSYLFENMDVLDNFPISDADFNEWKSSYLESKLKAHFVPQARKQNYVFAIKRTLRTFVGKMERVLSIAHDIEYSYDFSLFLPSSNKLSLCYGPLPEDYVFFPMQLSNDAQIISNYDGDIYIALNEALRIAERAGLPLVVKPHPAEVSESISDHLCSLSKLGKICLVNGNTFSIIRGADFVVTVNSTVGLESRLMGKEVVFLGDSIFEKIPDDKLSNYILGYLYNLDYFDDSPLPEEDYQKIDRMLELSQ